MKSILPIFLSFSLLNCKFSKDKYPQEDDKANQSAHINLAASTIDSNYLKGGWRCCKTLDYFMLMEITDTVYQFIDEENYFGPTYPSRYTIKGDSFFLDSDETWSKNRWHAQIIGSTTMVLTDQLDTIICNRIKLDLPLEKYTYERGKEYGKQFQALQKKFKCP